MIKIDCSVRWFHQMLQGEIWPAELVWYWYIQNSSCNLPGTYLDSSWHLFWRLSSPFEVSKPAKFGLFRFQGHVSPLWFIQFGRSPTDHFPLDHPRKQLNDVQKFWEISMTHSTCLSLVGPWLHSRAFPPLLLRRRAAVGWKHCSSFATWALGGEVNEKVVFHPLQKLPAW